MNSVDATAVWNSIETRWPRRSGTDEAKAWMLVLLRNVPNVERADAMVVLDRLQEKSPERRPSPAQFAKEAQHVPAATVSRGAYKCSVCDGTTWVEGSGDGVVRCVSCNGTGRTDTPPEEIEVDLGVSLEWLAQIKALVKTSKREAGGVSC